MGYDQYKNMRINGLTTQGRALHREKYVYSLQS